MFDSQNMPKSLLDVSWKFSEVNTAWRVRGSSMYRRAYYNVRLRAVLLQQVVAWLRLHGLHRVTWGYTEQAGPT